MPSHSESRIQPLPSCDTIRCWFPGPDSEPLVSYDLFWWLILSFESRLIHILWDSAIFLRWPLEANSERVRDRDGSHEPSNKTIKIKTPAVVTLVLHLNCDVLVPREKFPFCVGKSSRRQIRCSPPGNWARWLLKCRLSWERNSYTLVTIAPLKWKVFSEGLTVMEGL
jgi:hypothetical protein